MNYSKNEKEVTPPPPRKSPPSPRPTRQHKAVCTWRAPGLLRMPLAPRNPEELYFRPGSSLHPHPVLGAPTLAPIWLPHWPAWMCTISRMVLASFFWPRSASGQSVRPPLHTHCGVTGKALGNRPAKSGGPASSAFYARRVGRLAQAAPPAQAPQSPSR